MSPPSTKGRPVRRRRVPSARLTIYDVAAIASVSPGTVSKVLNEAPGVAAETRRRVREIVRELDFHPDASARSLVARKTGSIGVIIPHTGGYSMASVFWPVLLTAITDTAAARDLNVLLSTARSEEDVNSAYTSILRGRRVDGLIVGAEQFGQKQLVELLSKGFPFVMVGKSAHVSHWHVDVDNVRGAEDATRHLVSLGHRRIAMLSGPEDLVSMRERVSGFERAMADAGREARVCHCTYTHGGDAAMPLVAQLLAEDPPIDALFVGCADLTTVTLNAAAELGRTVPDDVALVAFDDHPYFDHFSPPVTAVSQPIHDLGHAALDMLFELMSGHAPDRERILRTRLVVRGSCGSRP